MQNIIIIGSEGFIGKHLRQFFENENYEVSCCDVLSLQRKNYFQIVDLLNDLNTIFENNNFDFCINSAGSANVQFSYSHHHNDFSLNSILVFNILTAIKNNNAKCKFLNFSSAAVYGNPGSLPINESHPTNPLSPYGWHKLYSEQICKEFKTFFGTDTLSLRVFSAYGPGLRKQLFWDIHQKIINEKHLKLFGTGTETRDFIFIDDIVHAVHCILKKGAFDGGSINIASGIETTVKNIAENYLRFFDEKTIPEFSGEIKTGDPKNWKADISKLRSLGFEPTTGIMVGMKKYFEWVSKDQAYET